MIKIEQITLEHFMCVKSATLNFNDSKIIIIDGNNGQGKSTIMEALAICFAEHRKADSMKDYVQKGFNHGKIIMQALIDKEPILFDITLNVKNGTPLERDVTYKNRVYKNSEVSDLLKKLDLSFYSDIILSMQGSADVITMTPTQRVNLLQKLFQFEFDDKIKIVLEKIEEAQKSIEINKSKIDLYNAEIESKEKLKNNCIEKPFPFTVEVLAQKELQLKEYVSQLTNLDVLVAEMTKNYSAKSALEKNALKIESEISALNKSLEDLIIRENKLQSFNFNSKKKEYKEKVADLEKELYFINSDIEDMKISIENTEINKNEFTTEVIALGANITDLSKKITLCKNGLCHFCGQKVEQTHLLELENELKDEQLKLDGLKNIQKESEIVLKTKNKDYEKFLKQKNTLEKELIVLKESFKTIDNQYSQLQEDVAKYDRVKILENINSKTKELNDIKLQLEAINKILAESDKKSEEIKQINVKHTIVSNEIKEYNNIAAQNLIIKENKNNYISSIVKYKEDISLIEKRIMYLEKDLESYIEARKVLEKELPNFLVVKTCSKLEQEMNDFIQIVFPDFKVRLLQSKRGVDFFYTVDPEVDMSNLKKLINSKMASGFERAVMSISFKVALCKAYNLTFAGLDEVDSTASDENSIKMFESLINGNVFEQLFFITHKSATKEIVKSLSNSVISYTVNKGKFSLEDYET